MKIGVVADTHSREIPKQLVRDFKNVDLIIHAGDFSSMKEFNVFKGMKSIKAVYGNMDDEGLRKVLPESDIFEFDRLRFGLWHGCGSGEQVINLAKEKFKDNNCDVVIFGHSHRPYNEIIDNTLFFNPGSPNDDIFAPFCSYGIIDIEEGKAKGKIIKVK